MDTTELPRSISKATPAPPRVSSVRGRYAIGTLITKKFNGIPYNGKVIGDNGQWCIIKYKDDNEEELTLREMTRSIKQANRVSFSNVWNNVYLGLVQWEREKHQQVFDRIRDFKNKAYYITNPETGKQIEY